MTQRPLTPSPIESDPRWSQLQRRDAGADGQFVYAVVTTGVFCRPSCKARPAKPQNVRFFDSTEAATAAGFRPCLRCHPTRPKGPEPSADLMRAMADYIRAHADQPLTLVDLASQAGLSPSHFQRRFTAVVGVSPKHYHSAQRLERFKARLKQGDSVLDATFEAGYGSTSRIYERRSDGLGMTPKAYRAGGAGEDIVYAITESALGPLLMAATERGVCCVQFGDDAEGLLDKLRGEYPHARLRAAADSTPLTDWLAALDAHLSQAAPCPALPLDLRGTAFQIRVWRFLLSVPAGSVVSYAELAAGIDAPKAVRAAGSACAANRLAVLIPCHRALRADGGLGGYRWGLERKRTLLELERGRAAAGR